MKRINKKANAEVLKNWMKRNKINTIYAEYDTDEYVLDDGIYPATIVYVISIINGNMIKAKAKVTSIFEEDRIRYINNDDDSFFNPANIGYMKLRYSLN